ncbi:4Fe-4S dicluster domain-containing protein [Mesohalobacter halotolerans]|uniref:(Fe-S)-binding protein n=1 Tax=Mesohalobacter halotolerans TaxID=1883405 RepID=A0A4U5TRW5_9FLAO|nr:4Fe-4S dicluster domain-containing protein [Mesohalobacter halotolerans]MBS3737645.1 (Fe-S)-binding protein [Psychroflexus sp.]TKS56833.1 (Fe-S)-binding protein [Mesohalobacter halotolerans]
MSYLPQILFIISLGFSIWFFSRNVNRLRRNILLGKDIDKTDHKSKRLKKMIRVALGQSKMVTRPIAGFLHVLVYVGFVIINIEVLEIIIDGILGTHRIFSFIGPVYDVLIGSFEVLALLVLISVILFWTRRNISKIKRFWSKEMTSWPKNDANNILYFEVVLMVLFLTMNATDYQLQLNNAEHYSQAGAFPISQYLLPLFEGFSNATLITIERSAWWLHILGIFFFLNYLYYSKHLHILLAFPNVYYSRLKPKGQFSHNETVASEVKMMMDPNADPYAAPAEGDSDASEEIPEKFGASDATDLNWFQLLSAYTCTECGRCTSECPANQTGKKLSPRKIMMDTRDRLEEIGENINKNGEFKSDEKQLLDDYISREELWACTTCNACVEACPIGIDPLSIIMDMRQYLVMEESAAPAELNNAMTNIENNAAPWPYNQQDRLNWVQDN